MLAAHGARAARFWSVAARASPAFRASLGGAKLPLESCQRVLDISAAIRRGASVRLQSTTAGSSFKLAPVGGEPSKDGPLFQTDRPVRNIAIIAHVDHGKTTLTDKLLAQAGVSMSGSMDSNPLERERGITILSKATALEWKGTVINICDTPGHSDFGGEVERILNMVDGVLLVVDAQEGPMPQTRFVTSKALAKGLKPILVLNKVDRESARLGTVENEVFELFCQLEANDEQLDFPILYASARQGWAVASVEEAKKLAAASAAAAAAAGGGAPPPPPNSPGMGAVLDAVLSAIPPPRVLGGEDAPFRMLVSQMAVQEFVGKTVLGRVSSGTVKVGDAVLAVDREGKQAEEGKVTKLFARRGMAQMPVNSARAGDIIELAGLSLPIPSFTIAAAPQAPAGMTGAAAAAAIAAAGRVRPLYADPIDPPTISMAFAVNDSPLGGREGTQLTSTVIAQRLAREAASNVALQVQPGVASEGQADPVEVRGRGELQLAILIEEMRRAGFELSVSPPAVLFRTGPDGSKEEPYEAVTVDVEEEHSGVVIESMAARKGNLKEFGQLPGGKSRLQFHAPSRGLIGLQSELKTATRGSAILHRLFDGYGPYLLELERKPRGVMVSNSDGSTTAYALSSLEPRGTLFIGPGEATYPGHIIGECSKEDRDMDVNPVRAKKLTNIRAAGHDEAIRLSPPRSMALEEALVYLAPDELLEVTPSKLRLRKRILDASERDRRSKSFMKALKAQG